MNLNEIKELIQIIDNSKLSGFEYEKQGEKIIIKKEASCTQNNIQTPVAVSHVPVIENTNTNQEVAANKYLEITSPIVGTFYESSSPGGKPFVSIGDKVKKGQVLCIVEAMKLLNEITAEFDCEIVNILVNNEEMVQFGQPLFEVK